MIEIDGHGFGLTYTINSLCRMEDAAGGALEDVFSKPFSAARLLLWGGMVENAPETSLKAAGEWIGRYIQEGGTLEEIVSACAKAMEVSGFFDAAIAREA